MVVQRTEIGVQAHTAQSGLRDTHVVTVEDGEDGMLVARCPELGIVTQGRSADDAQRNALEAVGLMRKELDKDGEFSIDVRKKD